MDTIFTLRTCRKHAEAVTRGKANSASLLNCPDIDVGGPSPVNVLTLGSLGGGVLFPIKWAL